MRDEGTSDARASRFVDVALLAAVAWTAHRRAALVFGERHPSDYDAFYYLTELRSRLEGRGSAYGLDRVFFATLEAVGRALSLDEIDTLRLSILLAWASFGGAVAHLARARVGSTFALALLTLVSASPVVWWLAYGFPKQVLACALVVAGAAAVERSRVLAGWAFVAVGAAMHAFAAVVACAFLAPRAIGRLGRGVSVVVALILVATAATVATGSGKLGELAQDVALQPRSTLERVHALGWIAPSEVLELASQWVLAPAAFAGWIAARRRDGRALATGAALFALFLACALPIYSFRVGGFAYRLLRSGALVFYVTVAVLAGARAGPGVRRAAVLVALAGAIHVAPDAPHPVGPGLPAEAWERGAPALRAWLPEDSLLIAPHGVQFQIHYFLRRRAIADRGAPVTTSGASTRRHVVRLEPEGCACPPVEALEPWAGCAALTAHWCIRDGSLQR